MPNKSMILGTVDDPEGAFLPEGLPPVIDSHVHVFPDVLFSAIWDWFDRHAWPIRYRLDSIRLIDFLLLRGVTHVVAFQYAHKPGLADWLNSYMIELCRARPGRVTGLATVFPGEPEAGSVLKTAFAAGLKGVKLHAHVQCFDMNSPDAEKYDTLWLDTAMVLADYFPIRLPFALKEIRADRIMYGSDFPNIPYAWDRELKIIRTDNNDEYFLQRFLAENARAFFEID